jgi:hypothetical protein
MEKKEIKKQLLQAIDESFDVVTDEERKEEIPETYTDSIDDITMRNLISDTEIDLGIYVGLEEAECGGSWNEVRKTNKKGFQCVIDEPTSDQSLDEWVEDIYEWLQVKVD